MFTYPWLTSLRQIRRTASLIIVQRIESQRSYNVRILIYDMIMLQDIRIHGLDCVVAVVSAKRQIPYLIQL